MKSNQGFLAVGIAIGLVILGLIGVTGVGYVEYKKRSAPVPISQATSTVDVLVKKDDFVPEKTTQSIKTVATVKTTLPEIKKETPTIVVDNTVQSNSNITTSSLSPENLWPLFDLVTKALENKDLKALNEVTYRKLTPEEWSSAPLIQFLYGNYAKTDKSTFINKWYDNKQAIYSTGYKKIETKSGISYENDTIIFVKDANDIWKILGGKGVSILGSASNSDSSQQEVNGWMVDSDKDGITDVDENCSKKQKYNIPCEIKTDATKRDTDGDGWWDGVEEAMR